MVRPALLVALAAVGGTAAAQTSYEARVPSYGCNSAAEVDRLEAARGDPRAFGALLVAQASAGQCVTIPRGAVVEGPATGPDGTTMLVNARVDPPGYRVPRADFRPKAAAR